MCWVASGAASSGCSMGKPGFGFIPTFAFQEGLVSFLLHTGS